MDFLNYHHLRYFWMVAREGSLRKAAERLHLSQPTISAQISSLEESLGEKLFRRSGRSLVMTDAGRRADGTCQAALNRDCSQPHDAADGPRSGWPCRAATWSCLGGLCGRKAQ